MKTNFFETLFQLTQNADWNITVRKWQKDKMIVSVLPFNDTVNDDAKKIVQPMILKGTPQELDKGFFSAIQKPLEETAALFANMENYLKQLGETKKQSKMMEEQQKKDKQQIEERKKKYETQIKKVSDLEEKEKWGEA